MVTYRDAGGLSLDGRLLVLQSTTVGPSTSFLVLDYARLPREEPVHAPRHVLVRCALARRLAALPDRPLDPSVDLSRYVVRAYDLRDEPLLPGRIADRTQKSWVMQGDAATRTTSPTGAGSTRSTRTPAGRRSSTRSTRVRGVAHCIGIPWTSTDQNGLLNVVLTLHGDRLAVHWRSGRQWLDVDTARGGVSPAARARVPVGLARLRLALAARALPALAAAGRDLGTLLAREA